MLNGFFRHTVVVTAAAFYYCDAVGGLGLRYELTD
jgi:hypothetical protein